MLAWIRTDPITPRWLRAARSCQGTLRAGTLALTLFSCGACQRAEPGIPQKPKPSSESALAVRARTERAFAPSLRKWVSVEAEQGHPKLALSTPSLQNPEERRLFARSTARLASAAAEPEREALLSDDDAVVAGWAAFGLGLACEGRERPTVGRLVLRAARGLARQSPQATQFFHLAISDALGRCGGRDAEASLRAWLDTDSSEPAVAGLLRMSVSQGALSESTLVALLRSAEAHPYQLAPFARLQLNSRNVCGRLVSVVQQFLKSKNAAHALVGVRALPACGAQSSDLLAEILLDGNVSVPVRAEALRALAKFGQAGPLAYAQLLQNWRQSGSFSDDRWLLSAEYGLARSVLASLRSVPNKVKGTLRLLAKLELEHGAGREPGPVELRKLGLRCASATLLAQENARAPSLLQCAHGYQTDLAELALLDVLERSEIDRTRLASVRALLDSKQLTVREQTLEMLGRQSELELAQPLLEQALASSDASVVTLAAKALSTRPLAHASADFPKVLSKAFFAAHSAFPETRMALMECASAYGVLSLVPQIERLCNSSNFSLRTTAERQLRLLGDRSRSCDKWQPGALPPEILQLPQHPINIQLETDIGPLKLSLDPSYAPLAVARLAARIKQGAWNGVRVERAVTGFMVQFGNAEGERMDGAAVQPLHSELSPVPFAELDVGISLSGRDTGASQVFVVLAGAPHLTGDFPWVGRASGAFSSLTRGDRILRATVSP